MRENLEATRGLVFSQPVLLKLDRARHGTAGRLPVVQRNAMKVWDEGKDFKTLARAGSRGEEAALAPDLDAAFDLDHELRHVDAVFERVLARRP